MRFTQLQNHFGIIALGGVLIAAAVFTISPLQAQTGTHGSTPFDPMAPNKPIYSSHGASVYEVHAPALLNAVRQKTFDAEYKGKSLSMGEEYRQAGATYLGLLPGVTEGLGDSWSGVQFSNIRRQGTATELLVVCNKSATRSLENRIVKARPHADAPRRSADIAARISGRIRSSESRLLYGTMVIWLEDGCKVDFVVPELTQKMIEAAPAVTLNQQAFAAAKSAQEKSDWDPKHYANSIWTAILKDKKVDHNELMFLEHVLAGPGEINVRPEGGGDAFIFRNYWVPEKTNNITGEIQGPLTNLRTLIRQNKQSTQLYAELEKFWKSDAIDMAGMIKWYKKDWIVHRELTTDFLGEKLVPFVKDSTVPNAYAPIRGAISRAYASINTLEGEDNAEARRLLYNAVRSAERRQETGTKPLPEFLYNWVQPKP